MGGLNPTFSISSSNGFPNFLATSSQKQYNGDKTKTESQRSSVSSIDSVFGSVPTRLEVEYAIAAFQRLLGEEETGAAEEETAAKAAALDRGRLRPYGPGAAAEGMFEPASCPAFWHLEQNKPRPLLHEEEDHGGDWSPAMTVDSRNVKMVVSISSDKTVWDAVMRNNEVQEFRRSLQQAEASRGSSRAEPDSVSMIMMWILDNMKLKFMQLIETLKSLLMNKSFESSQNKNTNPELKEGFEELIVSTVLSTITIIIVLVTRAYETS